jgi:hypothetical protein
MSNPPASKLVQSYIPKEQTQNLYLGAKQISLKFDCVNMENPPFAYAQDGFKRQWQLRELPPEIQDSVGAQHDKGGSNHTQAVQHPAPGDSWNFTHNGYDHFPLHNHSCGKLAIGKPVLSSVYLSIYRYESQVNIPLHFFMKNDNTFRSLLSPAFCCLPNLLKI